MVFEKDPQKILVKIESLMLNIGGTSEIIKTLKIVKQITQEL
jgi:TRAP-type mannitol/chloroaromatic compound transport system permease small subunit